MILFQTAFSISFSKQRLARKRCEIALKMPFDRWKNRQHELSFASSMEKLSFWVVEALLFHVKERVLLRKLIYFFRKVCCLRAPFPYLFWLVCVSNWFIAIDFPWISEVFSLTYGWYLLLFPCFDSLEKVEVNKILMNNFSPWNPLYNLPNNIFEEMTNINRRQLFQLVKNTLV